MRRDFSCDLEIEEMTEADLDEVMEIEKRSFASPWSKKLFLDTLSFPLSFNLVARKKVDKRIVGYANFYLITDEVQILNIAIAPESRRMGYATGLLERAIAMLRARGGTEFFLEVREGNAHAIELYRKLGFRKVGRRRRYYAETNEDALVMYLKAGHGSDHGSDR